MSNIDIKPGVQMAGLQLEMRSALIAADMIWSHYGERLVVTSALDGSHSAGSYHYFGLALDFRTRYFSNEIAQQAAALLREALGQPFDVVVHEHRYNDDGEMTAAGHIHVEYDYERARRPGVPRGTFNS